MIYYLVTERHQKTLTRWLAHFRSRWQGRFVLLPYEQLSGCLEPGVFIFSDYERLTPWLRRKAVNMHQNALNAGCVVLNDPQKSLLRYDLQKALNNAFRVFRPHEIPEDLRFPVFVRGENDHRGNRSPLLHTREKLDLYLANFPNLLTVEFVDTSNEYGLFRKYGATRIGDRIMPNHLLVSKAWMVKNDRALITAEFLEEEMEYLRNADHAEQLRKYFDQAKCEYGRIDYSFLDGEIQVWEINSNPDIDPTNLDAQQIPIFQLCHKHINDAFEALDARSSGQSQKVWCE